MSWMWKNGKITPLVPLHDWEKCHKETYHLNPMAKKASCAKMSKTETGGNYGS